MTRLLLLPMGALALVTGPIASAQTTAWINEVHYDNDGADTGEFVEVVLPTYVAASDYTLTPYNGSNGTPYGSSATLYECTAGDTIDADGDETSDYTFYECPASLLGGSLQNGPPDGLALTGPDPLNPAYPLIQFLSYEGPFTATSGIVQGQMSRDVAVEETGGTPIGHSLQLTGTGLAYESFGWTGPAAESPGQPNAGQTFESPSVTPTSYAFGSGDDDLAGHRQLGAAVAGLRVDDLAQQNLVQGVDGGAGFPAQYPDADGTTAGSVGPNLFTAYDGTNYAVAPSAASVLQVGRGFFWYLFDRDIDPDDGAFGGGTSESVALPQTQTYEGYTVAGDGSSVVDYTLAFGVTPGETFYLIANPLATDYDLTGVTARTAGATLSALFQVYDPGTNGFDLLTAGTHPLAAGQGAWAEVAGVSADALTLGFDLDAVAAGATFQGRRPSGLTVGLRLDGVVESGKTTVDRAAQLRLDGAAEAGWDRLDASKLFPMRTPFALIALVGERDGEPVRQAVRSVPVGPVTTDVAFTASEAGTFELTADVPGGWAVSLLDRSASTTADLAGAPYQFTADARDWSDRFELSITPAATPTDAAIDTAAEVGHPFPNPASGASRLRIRLRAPEWVTVVVYDALGRQVASVYEGTVAAGADHVLALPPALTPGVYIVRVGGETFAQGRQLTVIR